VVEGVDFGLGFNSFVFVGSDHFWGGNYNAFVFDRERSRAFFEHSTFHAGYRMEGGRLMAEGLGRDHMREITHHEIVEHKVSEMRRAEETHNFAKRTEEHKELTRAPERGRESGRPAAREHAAGAAPSGHPASGNTGSPANPRAGATAAPHSATPAVAGNAHPGATNQHGATTQTPAAHSPVPGNAANTRPGATGSNAKEATSNSKPPATKPKSSSTGTNQPPSAPK
jgi:hypothetical protein